MFGTDGYENLSNAFQVCFPESAHLLCDVHMVDNIERQLNKLNIKGHKAKQYIQDIFGDLKDGEKTKDIVECISRTEVENKMENLRSFWADRHE